MLSQTHEAQSSRGVIAGPVCALVLCFLLFSPAFAQHKHAQPATEPSPAQPAQSRPAGKPGVIKVGRTAVSIPDAEVLDQNGRKVRLYSDLIKGRVVVVSFFFTSCTLMCPLQGEALAKLSTVLGKKLGRDVFFISISKDPKDDTPRRLKIWGKQFGVGTGWTLVTGTEAVMSEVLATLIGAQPGPELHNAVLLVGNDQTGIWETAAGLSSPGKLVDILERVSGRF